MILKRVEGHTQSIFLQLMRHLDCTHPPDRVPFCCIPVQLQYKPSVSRLLLDRAAVREIASKSTWARLRAWVNDHQTVAGRSLSDIESKLLDALASVLGIEAREISPDDEFVALGCDSLMAMQFVAKCNQETIMVTVPDVFEAKCIAGLAAKLATLSAPMLPDINPVSGSQSPFDNLDSFQRDVEGISNLTNSGKINDVFPCTSAHRALFDKDAQLRAYTIWEASNSKPIDPHALAESFRRVVQRHSALRTILMPSRSHPSEIFHVVLEDTPIDVDVVVNVNDDDLDMLRQPSLLHSSDEIPYRFTIYRTSSGRVLCKLEGRYAVLDATSVLILLRELGTAYHSGAMLYQGPSYRSWAAYMHQWNQDPAHIEFWKRYLTGARPCFLPARTPDDNVPPRKELRTYIRDLLPTLLLREFCDRQNISITNALQFAWALVLSKYTASTDIVFGTLVSGRDAPVPDVNRIVGSLFNLVVCRFSLGEQQSIGQMLQQNQQSLHNRMTHQHCSLKEVMRTCGTETALFNTCLSVEQPLSSDTGIRFSEIETHEETGYDLVVMVTVSENLRINLTHWSTFLNEPEAAEIAGLFQESIKVILAGCL
ncbi:putative NRPS-like enzyme [Aspergillus clavatus NRRL 1]|uniref:NRPS-like enzyme, putative n=1 Tax=Aspergillus clavatus (strain ATCC 1007 / CBS 513.65 / DSM 816 / NCTC 3887 / NRRL 1 / QM 1276 / 107) TaxID=344612 RepID=A1CGD9_ASPCL|nr:NRPS-like enzyme, putative [Aspergillus clavatus NRRL 1]EAW11019.1 NRPS-like enzyme, putative [Aspergillus clavatus NRRL 1]